MNTTGVELSTSLTDDVWNSALFKTMFYIIILENRSFQINKDTISVFLVSIMVLVRILQFGLNHLSEV